MRDARAWLMWSTALVDVNQKGSRERLLYALGHKAERAGKLEPAIQAYAQSSDGRPIAPSRNRVSVTH